MNDWKADFGEIYASKRFDHGWYARTYPEVFLAGLTPLEHFVKYGAQIGRLPFEGYEQQPNEGENSLQSFLNFIRHKNEEKRPDYTGRQTSHARVTVICIAYNQAKYIRQTLDSILNQKTDFEFQLLVGDDCSTDGTAEIIKEYEDRFNNIIAVLRDRNIGPNNNFVDLARKVKTQYVAICEGDDYWTNEYKLSTQVAYLDENPNFSVCFHPVDILYDDYPDVNEVFPLDCTAEVSFHTLAHTNLIQTNSVVYRWRFGGCETFYMPEEVAPGDWFVHLLHAEVGRIAFINKKMAVYRKNSGGIWSTHASQLARYKIHGNKEIRFFGITQSLFGGLYSTEYRKAQIHIFTALVEAYALESRIDLMFELVLSNLDIAFDGLTSLGYFIDTASLGSIETFKKDIISKTKVSVIVTTYNHVAYIRRCLDSIISQKGIFDIEIIIGDDCSTDGTMAIVKEFQALHPDKIRVINRHSNVGMLTNMKECINLCSGDFIAICEGDDYWISEYNLAKKIAVLKKDIGRAMCFSWVLLEIEGQNSIVPHFEQGNISSGRVTFRSLAASPLTANFSCCVYRTAFIKTVPDEYYKRKNSADWLFNLYIADRGEIFYIKEILTVYTIQEKGQWSGLPDVIKRRRMSDCRNDFYQIFGEKTRVSEQSVKTRISNVMPHTPSELIDINLDFPVDGSLSKIGDGLLPVQGWAVLSADFPCFIVVEIGSSSIRYPVDQHRPDVMREINRKSFLLHSSDKCGFNFKIDLGTLDPISIFIEISGRACPWLEISFDVQSEKYLQQSSESPLVS